MAQVGPLELPESGYDAVIFDCDGTLVDSMPAHFEAWCEALSLHGAKGVLKEDVFYAMGGRIEPFQARIGAEKVTTAVEQSPFDFERRMRVPRFKHAA